MATIVALVELVAQGVEVNPTDDQLPGGQLIQQILNWLGQIALWGSLGSMLCGGAIYGLSQHAGNFAGATRGKYLALAGVIGAALTGIAPMAVNTIFERAQ